MSNYSNTKATIAANVYTNHNNEVTAEMVKTGINAVVDALIAGGFLYKGVAHPGDAAVSPDANVFYIASEAGTYTNKGGLVVADGEVAILKYNGSWTKEVTGAATAAEVSALGHKVDWNAKTGQVTPPQCTFFVVESTNLYDMYAPGCVDNKYVRYTDGELVNSSVQKASDYIPVTPGEAYITNYNGQAAFFDADGNYISGVSAAGSSFTAPAGAAFLRCSFRMDGDGVSNRLNNSATLLTYEPYSIRVPEKYLKLDNIHISAEQTGFFTQTDNLLNPNAADYQSGKYFAIDSQDQVYYNSSTSFAVSGYIKVEPGQKVNAYFSHSYAFFDSKKVYISGSYASAYNTMAATAPAGAAFVLINLYINKAETNNGKTNRVNVGPFLYPFVPYGYRLADAFGYKNSEQLAGILGENVDYLEEASMADGSSMILSAVPQSLCKNNRYAFSGKFSAFGTMIVGKGSTTYNARYFKITSTAVALYDYSDSESLVETKNHGLTISTYISFSVTERDGKADIILQTLSGTYTATFDEYAYYSNGQVRATASGMSLTDCKLSWANSDLKCDTWAFGDSYFGMNTTNREMYWLNEWGRIDEVLIQKYAGQNSEQALADLNRALEYGCPKRLIWALGMNNDNSSTLADITTGTWYAAIQQVERLCAQRGIEFIPATIPQPKSASYKNKDLMTAWVRSSGYRYVDVAAAVGSNAAGEWYGNGTAYDYQSTDDVHPSEYGAKAIATRFLLDVPELD